MKTRLAVAAAVAAAVTGVAHAALPAEIVINAERVFPESITSAADGSVFFGSIGNKAIYRAAPGSDKAELFVQPGTEGLQSTFGVFADNRTGTLWVCSNSLGGPPGGAPPPPATLYAFDLKTGAHKAHYAFPTAGGFCNDIDTLPDGTVFATDTNNMEVVRLQKGASALDVWVGGDGSIGAKGGAVDGISILGDYVVVNLLSASKLYSVHINKDGSPAKPVEVKTDKPIARPDGMRAFGKKAVLIIEGGDGGKLERVNFDGDKDDARVTLIKQGYPGGPVGVTVVGTTAYVAEGQFAGMRPPAPGTTAPALKPFGATTVEVGKP